MLMMTAKVDKKKIVMVLAAVAAAIVGLILLFGGSGDDTPTTAVTNSVSTNADRVKFLSDFGWDITVSPTESSQVRIPEKSSDVYDRYNALQKSMGYDLTPYAGKNVMRFVYRVNNYPGATEPVYATLLVYKNQVIGGDVTDTAAKGVIRGFTMPKDITPPASGTPSAE